MAEKFFTLTEISEPDYLDYPLVVRVLPTEYENAEPNDLPENIEILLEKPKTLQFAHVRIATFNEEQKERREKGDEFVEERNDFVGKDFLIPLCFPGTLKLLNKPDKLRRYSSMIQVKQDLPRYIRIDHEVVYTPPEKTHATSTLEAGTRLEIKRLSKLGRTTYVECKSVKTYRQYMFKEDFSIECSAADDPKEHTLLNLAKEGILLPKFIKFQNVWADDVVVKDDDDASKLLTLIGGPIKVLKLFVKRKVYIAWMKSSGTRNKSVALIPEKGWDYQMVEIIEFENNSKKEDYIKTYFGEDLDSSFVMSTLYTLKPDEAGIIWLIKQAIFDKEKENMDYENIEKTLVDYEKVLKQEEGVSNYEPVGSEEDKETDEESDDYEEPDVQPPPEADTENDGYEEPVAKSPSEADEDTDSDDYEEPDSQAQLVPDHNTHEQVQLPTSKHKKMDSHVLQMLKKKAMLGFDKVHEQLLKRAKTMHIHSAVKEKTVSQKKPNAKNEKESIICKEKPRLKSKNNSTEHDDCRIKTKSENLSKKIDKNDKDFIFPQFIRAYTKNKDRPLPDLPPTTTANVTDDDKIYLYDRAEDKEEAFLKKTANSRETHATSAIFPNMPDHNKISRQGQSCEDFYSYSVEELEECFELCGLHKLASQCGSNQLDGPFFRTFDMNDLKLEPFNLSNLDVIKVKKIIECGWRPKTKTGSNTC